MICPSCRAENEAAAEVCFTCRSVLSAITQGHVIAGRYEIVSFLGRGGMGAVYRAHDRLLEESVAIKILRADVAGTPELARRFRTEIKLARLVSHPNVCRIHEYGEEGSLRFISMELVEGRSLRDLLDRDGPFSAERACRLGAQMAAGLEAIHAAGVIHRDLKPPNVMLDAHDRVRLMDFGIAKQLAGAPNPTSDYVVGSPEYMSPEQGRGRQVDARSDIYSLGIVLFELVTGGPPFRGDTPVATLMMHVEQPPPLDGPAASRIPEPMRDLLRRALAKEPQDRFASARELEQVLRRLSGTAPAAPEPSRQRHDWRGPALLAALLGVGLTVVLARRPEAPAPAALQSPSPVVSVPATTAPTPEPVALPSYRESVTTPSRPSPELTPAVPVPTTPPPTPAPTRVPPPTVAETPQPAAAPSSSPVVSRSVVPAAETGMLAIVVSPWADVDVDGERVGQTPLRPFALPTGSHAVLLSHPDFQPFPRRVTIRAGETFRLQIDLPTDGVRKRPR